MTESILLSPAPRATASSPAVAHYLSFLSLPAAELSALVRAEVERNVVLVAHEAHDPIDEPSASATETELPVEEWMHDLGRPSFRAPVDSEQERHEGFLRSLPGRPESLHDSLQRQLFLLEEDPWRRWLGEQIVFSLDERGYLRGHLCHILDAINDDLAARTQVLRPKTEGRERRAALLAAAPTEMPEERIVRALLAATDENGALLMPLVRVIDRVKAKPAEAEAMLRTIQGLEPTGVGARDVRECLLLQLRERGGSPMARRVVERCLREAEKGSLKQVQHSVSGSMKAVRAAVKTVLALDRAPGLSVAARAEGPAPPDVVAERRDGGWLVRMVPEGAPRLSVSRHYARRVKETEDAAEKRYLEEGLASAQAIVWAIGEREKTLLKVCEAVVEAHGTTLARGKGKGSPVTLRELAKKLEMPVSTIALAIAGKTMATPSGVVTLASLVTSTKDTKIAKKGKGKTRKKA